MNRSKNNSIRLSTRFFRRAITVTALAVFVIVTAVTLASFSPAVAERAAVTGKMNASKSGSKVTKNKAGKNGKALTGVLNINTASEDQLQMLPGIGPTKAERVVAYRTKRGKFKRVKDLRRVKGFGYKTLKKLKPFLTVKGPTTLQLGPAD